MKKFAIFIALILVATLCSCSSASKEYVIEKNGISYELNTEESIIFDGKNTYVYEFEGTDSSYTVNIIYPDGSSYHWKQRDMYGSGGWSDDYDPSNYVSGDILRDILEEKAPKEANVNNFLVIVLFLIVGILNIVSPLSSWYLSYGWRYKNSEPSDIALVLCRVSGVICIIIAIVMILQ